MVLAKLLALLREVFNNFLYRRSQNVVEFLQILNALVDVLADVILTPVIGAAKMLDRIMIELTEYEVFHDSELRASNVDIL